MNPSAGLTATRYAKSLGMARGNIPGALGVAHGNEHIWPNARSVIESLNLRLKGAVTATGTSDIGLPTPAEYDLAEFVRPPSVLGKVTGFRRVPGRVRQIAVVAGSTAHWRGERAPGPINRATLEGETLETLAIIAMIVSTLDLLRSNAPAADSLLSRDIAAAMVSAMDAALLNWEDPGEPGVRPAGIGYGVTPLVSTGSSLAQIDADLAAMIQALSDAGSDLAMATWVLKPRTALYLARLRGTGGALAHPGMTAKGGTLLGLPAVTSTAVAIEAGSPTSNVSAITLLDPSQILVADDGGGAIEVSEHASLQMTDSPGSGAQSMVSLWQCEAAALKLTRYANWKRCRDGVVQVLSEVTY